MPKGKNSKAEYKAMIKEPRDYSRLYEAANDMGQEYFPFVYNTLINFKDATNSVTEWVKTSTPFRRNPGGTSQERRIYQMGNSLFDAAKRDIKEFRIFSFKNLNEKIEELIDGMGSRSFDDSYDAELDESDSDYSSFDGLDTDTFAEGTAINAQAIVDSASIATDAITDTQVKTSDYMAKRIVSGTNVAIGRVLKYQAATADILNAVNNNMTSLVETMSKSEAYHEQALQFFQRTEESFNDIKKLLQNAADPAAARNAEAMERSMNRSDNDFIEGGFDPAKYFKQIWNNSMFGTMGKFVLGSVSPIAKLFGFDFSKLAGGMFEGIEITPIKDLFEASPLARQIASIDQQLEDITKVFFHKAGSGQLTFKSDFMKELYNGLRMLGLFGNYRMGKQSYVRLSDYDKEATSVTGKTLKAIETVIPSYLSNIENDITALLEGFSTGQFYIGTFEDQRMKDTSPEAIARRQTDAEYFNALKSREFAQLYDYDEGRFTIAKKAVDAFKQERDFYLQNAFSSVLPVITQMLDQDNITDEEMNAFNVRMTNYLKKFAQDSTLDLSTRHRQEFFDLFEGLIDRSRFGSEEIINIALGNLFNNAAKAASDAQKNLATINEEVSRKNGVIQNVMNRDTTLQKDKRFQNRTFRPATDYSGIDKYSGEFTSYAGNKTQLFYDFRERGFLDLIDAEIQQLTPFADRGEYQKKIDDLNKLKEAYTALKGSIGTDREKMNRKTFQQLQKQIAEEYNEEFQTEDDVAELLQLYTSKMGWSMFFDHFNPKVASLWQMQMFPGMINSLMYGDRRTAEDAKKMLYDPSKQRKTMTNEDIEKYQVDEEEVKFANPVNPNIGGIPKPSDDEEEETPKPKKNKKNKKKQKPPTNTNVEPNLIPDTNVPIPAEITVPFDAEHIARKARVQSTYNRDGKFDFEKNFSKQVWPENTVLVYTHRNDDGSGKIVYFDKIKKLYHEVYFVNDDGVTRSQPVSDVNSQVLDAFRSGLGPNGEYPKMHKKPKKSRGNSSGTNADIVPDTIANNAMNDMSEGDSTSSSSSATPNTNPVDNSTSSSATPNTNPVDNDSSAPSNQNNGFHTDRTTTAGEQAADEDAPVKRKHLDTIIKDFINGNVDKSKTFGQQSKELMSEISQNVARLAGNSEEQKRSLFGKNGILKGKIADVMDKANKVEKFLFGEKNEDGTYKGGVFSPEFGNKLLAKKNLITGDWDQAKEDAKRDYLIDKYGEDFETNPEYLALRDKDKLKEHRTITLASVKTKNNTDENGIAKDTYDYDRVNPLPHSGAVLIGWEWLENKGWHFKYNYNNMDEYADPYVPDDITLPDNKAQLPGQYATNAIINALNMQLPPTAEYKAQKEARRERRKLHTGVQIGFGGKVKGFAQYDAFDAEDPTIDLATGKRVIKNIDGVDYELFPVVDKHGNIARDEFGQVKAMYRKVDMSVEGDNYKEANDLYNNMSREEFLNSIYGEGNPQQAVSIRRSQDDNKYYFMNSLGQKVINNEVSYQPVKGKDGKMYISASYYDDEGNKHLIRDWDTATVDKRQKEHSFFYNGKKAVKRQYKSETDDDVYYQASYYNEGRLNDYIGHNAKEQTRDEYYQMRDEFKAEKKKMFKGKTRTILGFIIGNAIAPGIGGFAGAALGSGVLDNPLKSFHKKLLGDYTNPKGKGIFAHIKFALKHIGTFFTTIAGFLIGNMLFPGVGGIAGAALGNSIFKRGGLIKGLLGGKNRYGEKKKGLLGHLLGFTRKTSKAVYGGFKKVTADSGPLDPILGTIAAVSAMGPMGLLVGPLLGRAGGSLIAKAKKGATWLGNTGVGQSVKGLFNRINEGNGNGVEENAEDSEGYGPIDDLMIDSENTEHDQIPIGSRTFNPADFIINTPAPVSKPDTIVESATNNLDLNGEEITAEAIEDQTESLSTVIQDSVGRIEDYLRESDERKEKAEEEAAEAAREAQESAFAKGLGNPKKEPPQFPAELMEHDEAAEEPKKESWLSKISSFLLSGNGLKIAGVAIAGLLGAGLISKFLKTKVGISLKEKVGSLFTTIGDKAKEYIPPLFEKATQLLGTAISGIDWSGVVSAVGTGLAGIISGAGSIISSALQGIDAGSNTGFEMGALGTFKTNFSEQNADGTYKQNFIDEALGIEIDPITGEKTINPIGAADYTKKAIATGGAKTALQWAGKTKPGKVVTAVGKGAIKVGSNAVELSKAVAKGLAKCGQKVYEFISKFATGLPQLLAKVKGGIGGIKSSFANKIVKAAGTIGEKLGPKIMNSKVYNFAMQHGPNLEAKLAAKGLTVTGLATTLAFATYGAATGAMWGASDLFGIDEGQADRNMRAISALMNAIFWGTTWGAALDFISEIITSATGIDLKKTIATIIYGAVSDDDSERKLANDQAEFQNRMTMLNTQLESIGADTLSESEFSNEVKLSGKDYWDKGLAKLGNGAATALMWAVPGAGIVHAAVTGKATWNPFSETTQHEKEVRATRNMLNAMEVKDLYQNQSVENMSADENVGSGRGTSEGYGSTSSVGFGKSSDGHYSQLDNAWKNLSFGKTRSGMTTTIGSGGCGPTALATVARSLTGNNKITPTTVANMAQDYGYTANGGSAASLFTEGANRLGLSSQRIDVNDIPARIAMGQKVIVSGKKKGNNSPYTNAGHIISLSGVRGGKAVVDDPLKNSTETRKVSDVLSGAKKAWVIGGNRSVGYGSPEEFTYNMLSMGYGFGPDGELLEINDTNMNAGSIYGYPVNINDTFSHQGVFYQQGQYNNTDYPGMSASMWNDKDVNGFGSFSSSGCFPTSFATTFSNLTKLDVDPWLIIRRYGNDGWNSKGYKWNQYANMFNTIYGQSPEDVDAHNPDQVMDVGFKDALGTIRDDNEYRPSTFSNLDAQGQYDETIRRIQNTLKNGGAVWVDGYGKASFYGTGDNRTEGHAISFFGYHANSQNGGDINPTTTVFDPGHGFANNAVHEFNLNNLSTDFLSGRVRRISTFPRFDISRRDAVKGEFAPYAAGHPRRSADGTSSAGSASPVYSTSTDTGGIWNDPNANPIDSTEANNATDVSQYADLYKGYKYIDDLNLTDDSFTTKLGNFATIIGGIANNIMESILGGKQYESVFGHYDLWQNKSTFQSYNLGTNASGVLQPHHKYVKVSHRVFDAETNSYVDKDMYIDVGDTDLSNPSTIRTIATEAYQSFLEETVSEMEKANNPSIDRVKNVLASPELMEENSEDLYNDIYNAILKEEYVNGKYYKVNSPYPLKSKTNTFMVPAWYDKSHVLEEIQNHAPYEGWKRYVTSNDYVEKHGDKYAKMTDEELHNAYSLQLEDIYDKDVLGIHSGSTVASLTEYDAQGVPLEHSKYYVSEENINSTTDKTTLPTVAEAGQETETSNVGNGEPDVSISSKATIKPSGPKYYDENGQEISGLYNGVISVPENALLLEPSVVVKSRQTLAQQQGLTYSGVSGTKSATYPAYATMSAGYSAYQETPPASSKLDSRTVADLANYVIPSQMKHESGTDHSKVIWLSGESNYTVGTGWYNNNAAEVLGRIGNAPTLTAEKRSKAQAYAKALMGKYANGTEIHNFLTEPDVAAVNENVQNAMHQQLNYYTMSGPLQRFDEGTIRDPRGIMQVVEFSGIAPATVKGLRNFGDGSMTGVSDALKTMVQGFKNYGKYGKGWYNRINETESTFRSATDYPSSIQNAIRASGYNVGYGEAEGYGDLDGLDIGTDSMNISKAMDSFETPDISEGFGSLTRNINSSPKFDITNNSIMKRMIGDINTNNTSNSVGFGVNNHHDNHSSMRFENTRQYAPNIDSHDKTEVNVDLTKLEDKSTRMVQLLEAIVKNTKNPPSTTINHIHESDEGKGGQASNTRTLEDKTIVVTSDGKINNTYKDKFRKIHDQIAASPRSYAKTMSH